MGTSAATISKLREHQSATSLVIFYENKLAHIY